MPKDFPRALRVAEQIRREIAELLRSEVKDPRVGMVTISDVEVSRDLKHAKIYFTALGDQDLIDSSQAGLDSAVGFLRHELGKRLKVRTIPDLRFIYDYSLLQGERIDALIDAGLAETQASESVEERDRDKD